MSVTSRLSGFSLIEVVIASALLALICASASGVFAVVFRSFREQLRRDHLESVFTQELAHLEALPYWCATTSSGSELASTADSLLLEVFPHADPTRNTANASFFPIYQQGGAGFVTTGEVSGVRVRRVASFVSLSRTGVYTALPVDKLMGWSASSGVTPPSCAIAVTLEVSQSGHLASHRIILSWLRPSLALVARLGVS